MRVRPIDENGDMIPVYSASQMFEGAKAVAQIAKDRLLFFKGEWWEDDSLGVSIPEYMISSMRGDSIGLFGKYITSYIAGTEGVTEITDVNVIKTDSMLEYGCILKTGDGQEQLEVNLDGLL